MPTVLDQLRAMTPTISVGLLTADLMFLGDEIARVQDAGEPCAEGGGHGLALAAERGVAEIDHAEEHEHVKRQHNRGLDGRGPARIVRPS